MCFKDKSCYDLYNYIMDQKDRDRLVNQCPVSDSLGTSCSFTKSAAMNSFPVTQDPSTMQKYRPDMQALSAYVYGDMWQGTTATLRASKGQDVPTDLKDEILLLSSGLNILGKNKTAQKWVEKPHNIVFRGEPVYPGAPCVPKGTGSVQTGTERTLWAFTSWSRVFRFAAGWSIYTAANNYNGVSWINSAYQPTVNSFKPGRVLALYRRQNQGGGAYIQTAIESCQYEFTTIPGLRVKSLECEQSTLTLDGYSPEPISIEYVYDVTDQPPASPSEEAAMLAAMKKERKEQETSCWTWLCDCQGASANHDPNAPLPNTQCTFGGKVFAASGSEDFRRAVARSTHAPSSNVVPALVAGVFAMCLIGVVLALVRHRRRQSSFQVL